MTGQTHPPDKMFFRLGVGSAENDTHSFELSVNMSDHTPIVRCTDTGRWFTLSWQDILDLGKAAGITEPEPATGEHDEAHR